MRNLDKREALDAAANTQADPTGKLLQKQAIDQYLWGEEARAEPWVLSPG